VVPSTTIGGGHPRLHGYTTNTQRPQTPSSTVGRAAGARNGVSERAGKLNEGPSTTTRLWLKGCTWTRDKRKAKERRGMGLVVSVPLCPVPSRDGCPRSQSKRQLPRRYWHYDPWWAPSFFRLVFVHSTCTLTWCYQDARGEIRAGQRLRCTITQGTSLNDLYSEGWGRELHCADLAKASLRYLIWGRAHPEDLKLTDPHSTWGQAKGSRGRAAGTIQYD
jgi:hypothetical protein